MIQSKNPSCVPRFGPGTTVHLKDKDTRSNPEHKEVRNVEFPCHVLSRCCTFLRTCGKHIAMTKHAHRVINLANGDVDLVGTFDKTWKCFCCSAMLTTFKFVQITSTSLVKHQSRKVSFLRHCHCVSPLVFGQFDGEELSSVTGSTHLLAGWMTVFILKLKIPGAMPGLSSH